MYEPTQEERKQCKLGGCSYGICDECAVTRGHDTEEEDNDEA